MTRVPKRPTQPAPALERISSGLGRFALITLTVLTQGAVVVVITWTLSPRELGTQSLYNDVVTGIVTLFIAAAVAFTVLSKRANPSTTERLALVYLTQLAVTSIGFMIAGLIFSLSALQHCGTVKAELCGSHAGLRWSLVGLFAGVVLVASQILMTVLEHWEAARETMGAPRGQADGDA